MEFEINGEISTESNGNDVLNHHEEVFRCCYRSTLGCYTGSDQVLCKMTLPLGVNYRWRALERQAWF